MRIDINVGFTNKVKYFENDTFVLHKTLTGFNHLLDYTTLAPLPFVPRLISNDSGKLVWAKIDGKMLQKPLEADLVKLAKTLRFLHQSNIKLPKNNLRRRLDFYIKETHAKGLRPPVIDQFYQEMRLTLAKMRQHNPCHNDVWGENILKTATNELFLVDWEYATMGDKHFDLAFYISAAQLSADQEATFLNAYDAVDGDFSYDPHILLRHKRLAHYLTVCWAYAQEKMPYDISWIEKYLVTTTLK